MYKYIALFLLVSLVPCAFADDDPPAAPTRHPLADTFINAASDFVDNKMDGVNGFNGEQYMAELNDIADQIPVDAPVGSFNPQAYMNGVNAKVDAMLANLGQNSGTLRDEYLHEVSNFFLTEYIKDMKNGVVDLSTSQYLADMDNLNANYQSRLDALNSPPVASGNGFPNPTDFLDATFGETRRDTKIEFFWGGVGDHWLNYNMIGLVNAFQNRFNHDSVAQADFQYLKDLWPQSAEAYLMNTAYNDGDYTIYNSATGDYQSEFVIDEYGMPAGDGEYDPNQFNVGSNATSASGGRYNNRSYGYRYSNGTHTVAKITTNGRSYTLTETIYTSPLLLDLDGDGAIEASKGKWLPHRYEGARLVEFDMNGDGFVDLTEWVGPNDGLLMVYDKSKSYVDATDLFGNAGGFDNGYEKLSLLDANRDGKITGAELATLSVWRDLNGNARVDDKEVLSVEEMGITLLGLTYDRNYVSYFVQDGKQKQLLDWYPTLFDIKRNK